MSYTITAVERDLLRTYHGNAIPARDVRRRLRAAGGHYCHACDKVLPVERFAKNQKPGKLQGRCRRCDHLNRARRRRYLKLDTRNNLPRAAWLKRNSEVRRRARASTL
jgi:hypothetical protein